MTQESHVDQWQPPPLKKDDNQPAWQPPPISETEAPSAWQPPPPPPAQGGQKPIHPVKATAHHPPRPFITRRGLRIALPVLLLVGSGTWLAMHQADIKPWIQQSRVRISLWLRHPGEAEISNDIAGQLEDLVRMRQSYRLPTSNFSMNGENRRENGSARQRCG